VRRDDEAGPRQEASPDQNSDATQSTGRLRQIRERECERRWRREHEYDPMALARCVGEVDRAVRAASDPKIDAQLNAVIERLRRRFQKGAA
jgi:hypothetical protein